MNWYPQVGAGSIAQFPLHRSRKWRMISNVLESGERVVLADAAAGQIDWSLSYRDLTDAEINNLTSFFASSQGRFGAFTFVDPLANLFGWSEDLSRSDWQAGLLQSQAEAADPLGTQRASSLVNPTSGAQTLAQTLTFSGDYVSCFSVYLRSETTGSITVQRDSAALTTSVGPAWKRTFLSGPGSSGASQSTFSVVLQAGQAVDIWGLQVEAQPYPSAYKQTGAALGIYEETYFGTDELTITNDGPGLSSCSVVLESRC